MKQVHKEYDRPFLLEPTKLTRLVDKIHERLADQQHTTQHDYFEVFLTGNRREEMTNIDDVLALDNSPRGKIQRLVIVCSASTAGAARPEHEVQVDFASPITTTSGEKKTVVAISVRSDVGWWAARTLSEVEEQVERTWLHYVQPVLVLLGIVLCVLIFVALQFGLFRPQGRDGLRMMWLQDSDLDRVEALVREQRIITDQELREMVTRQLRNVLEYERTRQSPVKGGTRQVLFLGIPLAVVMTCIIILLSTCYPRAVFLWGDEVDRHSNMLQRRKILWGVIVGVFIVGLLSKFLYEGIGPLFPPG